jgi:hypothetical protein
MAAAFIGERAQEEIHRQVRAAATVVPRHENQPAVTDPDVGLGGNDVHVVGLDVRAVDRLADLHARRLRQRLAQEAGVPGSRCWISTNAIPVFTGMHCKSWVKASSPPAEAPMPTTGNSEVLGRSGGAAVTRSSATACAGLAFGLALAGHHRTLLAAIMAPILSSGRQQSTRLLMARFVPSNRGDFIRVQAGVSSQNATEATCDRWILRGADDRFARTLEPCCR